VKRLNLLSPGIYSGVERRHDINLEKVELTKKCCMVQPVPG